MGLVKKLYRYMLNSTTIPVVIIADLMAALLQLGCMAFRSAATAATWGQDMEVPEAKLYLKTRWSSSSFVGEIASLQAAKMFIPGAVISGCQETPGSEFLRHFTIDKLWMFYLCCFCLGKLWSADTDTPIRKI